MKTKRIFALLLAVCLMLCALTSCSLGGIIGDGNATVVVAGSETVEYKVNLNKIEGNKGLVSVLDYLKEKENLDYAITGTMLDYVGDVKNDYDKGEYVYIYTTVEKDKDVSEWATTVDYKGTTLTSAGVGATEMSLEDGAIIYIGIIKW